MVTVQPCPPGSTDWKVGRKAELSIQLQQHPSVFWVPRDLRHQPALGEGSTHPVGDFSNSARHRLLVDPGPWVFTTLGLGSGSSTLCPKILDSTLNSAGSRLLHTPGFWNCLPMTAPCTATLGPDSLTAPVGLLMRGFWSSWSWFFRPLGCYLAGVSGL